MLALKNRLTLRDYQEPILEDIFSHINSGDKRPYVLGSAPSSGKTEMAIETIIRLFEQNLADKILILAHSTNVLKENFYNRLLNYFDEDDIAIFKSNQEFNHNCKIQVMIPQNIKYIKGHFGAVITDEAHHNVLAEDGNYTKIIKKVKPKFQLLLTGTPSKFIRENDLKTAVGEEPIYNINAVGMDVIGFDTFHNVKFDLVKSAYTFKLSDYNADDNLFDSVNFSKKETKKTINNLIAGVVRNVCIRHGIILPTNPNFNEEARKLIHDGKFGKTLVICRNISHANQIANILENSFNHKVYISESDNDLDSSNLEKFKEKKDGFLCVVNRAREGFDDKTVVNLIDITMSHNIDLIYQMFCRVVRKDTDNPNDKLYVKITSDSPDMSEYTMNIMTAALMLAATMNIKVFNGKNFRGVVIPRIEKDAEDDVIFYITEKEDTERKNKIKIRISVS